jgi:hypothetical protein
VYSIILIALSHQSCKMTSNQSCENHGGSPQVEGPFGFDPISSKTEQVGAVIERNNNPKSPSKLRSNSVNGADWVWPPPASPSSPRQGLAGTKTFDFETNPTNEGIQFFGNSEWVQSGGNPGGFLVVTRAIDSQKSVLVFPDIDDGLLIRGFTFEADVRCGGGEDPPADGFSMNYARSTDPVVLDPGAGAFAARPDRAIPTSTSTTLPVPPRGSSSAGPSSRSNSMKLAKSVSGGKSSNS